MVCMSWTEVDSAYRCMIVRYADTTEWVGFVGMPDTEHILLVEATLREGKPLGNAKYVGKPDWLSLAEGSDRVFYSFPTCEDREKAIETCERMARYLSWKVDCTP